MGDRNNLRFNQSGYRDPTAHDALQPIIAEERRKQQVVRLLRVFKEIAALSGFEVIEPAVLRHKKTGNEYR